MNLSCYHCTGTEFVLVVLEDGATQIECVDHDAHVAEISEVDG